MRALCFSRLRNMLGLRALLTVSLVAMQPTLARAFPARVSAIVTIIPAASSDTGNTLLALPPTITTDSVVFALGHKDWARYDNPGLCDAAARITLARARLRLDSYRQGRGHEEDPAEDTIGLDATAAVARACGARYTLANTTSRQAHDLFALAIYQQNDTLAQAALNRKIPAHGTSADTAGVWSTGMELYLRFSRFDAAKSLMAHVDAQSSPAARSAQNDLHVQLYQHFYDVHDTLGQRQESQQLIARGVHDPDRYKAYNTERYGWIGLVRLAIFAHQPDSIRVFAAQAQNVLRNYTSADQIRTVFDRYIDWGHIPVDSAIAHLAPAWFLSQVHGHGHAPRLTADYWFPAPGSPPGDTVFPVPGKVNLLCLGIGPGGQAFEQANLLRDWLKRYGSKGLVITIVRRATGYPGVFIGADKSMFATPAAEANLWHWYDQVYHQLPVVVAVQVQRTTQWLPDGRRLNLSDIQFQQYVDSLTPPEYRRPRSAEAGSCIVIGRDGTILHEMDTDGMASGVRPEFERLLTDQAQ